MANDSLSSGHVSVNQRHHAASPATVKTLTTHLETARSWCECLIRHDFSHIEISPPVLRQHLFALAEALEQAYETGKALSNKDNILPFAQENNHE